VTRRLPYHFDDEADKRATIALKVSTNIYHSSHTPPPSDGLKSLICKQKPPMDQEELLALLCLCQTPQLGDGSIKKLIHAFGSASDVLSQPKSKLLQIEGIGEAKLKHLGDPAFHAFAKAEVALMQKNDITATAFYEPNYPQRLTQCYDGPALLFARGAINWNHERILSIVGSRKITTYGKQLLYQLFEEMAPFRPMIISGFAYGVDIGAHLQALKHDLPTVAVLAHGLDHCYPKPHKKYMQQLIAHGGFVSDFCCGAPFVHTNFLRRNRIIAGLSEATLVIESAARGGSLVTADFANGYHRDVFAVPGRVGDRQSKGCNDLIKQQKAHLLTSVADLVYLLNWSTTKPSQKTLQTQLFEELSDSEQHILTFLQQHGKQHLDTIALKCLLPSAQVAASLFQLEMKNVIRALPGKCFEIC
jgi:DNA processing protein